jgi:flagella synthesis protein FlgN
MNTAMAARPATATGARTLPRAAVERLLGDVRADLHDHAELQALLDQQFEAALRHDAAALEPVATRILALVEQLDARRQLRDALVSRLSGHDGPPSVHTLLGQWPAAQRPQLQALWAHLEQAVQDSKNRNLRNARLMTEQQAMLIRVMHGSEDGLYADT